LAGGAAVLAGAFFSSPLPQASTKPNIATMSKIPNLFIIGTS
jgi:hypothetical protein